MPCPLHEAYRFSAAGPSTVQVTFTIADTSPYPDRDKYSPHLQLFLLKFHFLSIYGVGRQSSWYSGDWWAHCSSLGWQKRMDTFGAKRTGTGNRICPWRIVSSGMLRCVALVRIDVLEELSASIIRVTRIGELGTTLAVTSNRRTLRRNTSISCTSLHVFLRSVRRLLVTTNVPSSPWWWRP
jgi:hypothetical protein